MNVQSLKNVIIIVPLGPDLSDKMLALIKVKELLQEDIKKMNSYIEFFQKLKMLTAHINQFFKELLTTYLRNCFRHAYNPPPPPFLPLSEIKTLVSYFFVNTSSPPFLFKVKTFVSCFFNYTSFKFLSRKIMFL